MANLRSSNSSTRGDSPPLAAEHSALLPRLHRLLQLEQGDVWVVAGYSVAIGLLALATPIAVQALVNQITFTALLQPIVVMTLLVLLGWGLSGLLRALQFSVVELLQQRLFIREAAELAAQLPHLDVAVRQSGPSMVSRFLEVVTVQKSVAGLLLDALGIVLQSLLGLLVLAFYHPLLLAFDALLICCIVLIVWGLGRGGVRTSIVESQQKYAVLDWLSDVARQPELFALPVGAAYARAHLEERLGGYLEARRGHFRVLIRQIGGALLLQALGSAALLGIGGALVIAGQLTIGQLVAAELIVSGVVAGVAKLGKHLESYYDLMAALDKLGHLDELPRERLAGESLHAESPVAAAVQLRGVVAGYTAERRLLDEVNLELRPGEHAALVAPSGSGKSLLCDLLLGLREPERGRIELDGQEVRRLELGSLRRQVLLLRTSELVGGTLADNLRVERSLVPAGELRAALQAVGLWSELAESSVGLEVRLRGDAQLLSAGQRRRLLVARALLFRPRLLLIDDELALDAEALAPLCGQAVPWTMLLCAQPESPAAQLFPRHYLLQNGRLQPAQPAPLSPPLPLPLPGVEVLP